MDRLIQAPRIASGGFAGGVSSGAAGAPEGNELIDLANAMGTFSGEFSRAYSTWHGNDQERKRINQDIQRKDAEAASAQIIANDLQGYTAAQMGEALASEPLAKKFSENPYILPAVQLHRGRKAADEAAQRMTEAGVDVSDAKAVAQWTKENLGKLDDPFLARGFNEQWERWSSQFAQMSFKALAEAAETDRQNIGSSEWDLAIHDSKDLPVADRVANAMEELYAVPGISGAERSEIQMTKLRQAAATGDVELAEAIANAKRGDAPAILADARLGGQAAAYVETARTERLQRRESLHVETQTKLWDMITSGITIPMLEQTPEYQLLKAEDPEKQASIDNRIRSYIAQQRDEAERKAKEAARDLAASRVSSWENERVIAAAQLLGAGRGEFIQGESATLGEGVAVSVSTSQLRQEGMNVLRASVFPSGFEGLSPDELLKVKPYVRNLAAGNVTDPVLQGFLQGASAYMTIESLAGNEKYLAGAFDVYRQMDPHHAAQYVPDVQQRAVYAKMDQLLTSNPSLPLDQVAARAVASVHLPKPPDTPADVRAAAAAIRLRDHANPNKGGLFGMGAGPNDVDVTDSQMYGELLELTIDFQQAGLDRAAALAAARKEVEGSYIAVNGRPLRLPNDPKYPGETPERWSEVVNLALQHAAAEFGGSPQDYVIQHAAGMMYSIRRPSGEVDFLPATRIRALATERLAANKLETEAARTRAIGEAVRNP